jgi:hypothetical protein
MPPAAGLSALPLVGGLGVLLQSRPAMLDIQLVELTGDGT